jgi:hypothetical protein
MKPLTIDTTRDNRNLCWTDMAFLMEMSRQRVGYREKMIGLRLKKPPVQKITSDSPAMMQRTAEEKRSRRLEPFQTPSEPVIMGEMGMNDTDIFGAYKAMEREQISGQPVRFFGVKREPGERNNSGLPGSLLQAITPGATQVHLETSLSEFFGNAEHRISGSRPPSITY